MARRIITATRTCKFEYQHDVYKKVGQLVASNCIIDDSKSVPLWQYIASAEKFIIYNRLTWDNIAEINAYEDLSWIKEAIFASPESPFLLRIDQLDFRDENGKSVLKLEAITGSDARFHIANEKREYWTKFAQEHWWKFVIGGGIFWLSL